MSTSHSARPRARSGPSPSWRPSSPTSWPGATACTSGTAVRVRSGKAESPARERHDLGRTLRYISGVRAALLLIAVSRVAVADDAPLPPAEVADAVAGAIAKRDRAAPK